MNRTGSSSESPESQRLNDMFRQLKEITHLAANETEKCEEKKNSNIMFMMYEKLLDCSKDAFLISLG